MVGIRCAWLVLLLVWGAACAGARTPEPQDPATREAAAAFLANPAYTHAALSPDGRWIAAILDGAPPSLFAKEVNGDALRLLLRLDQPGSRVLEVGWSGRERIVLRFDAPDRERRGRARRIHAMAVHPDRPPTVRSDRLPSETLWDVPFSAQGETKVLHWLPEDEEHVIEQRYDASVGGVSVGRVHVRSGVWTEIAPARPGLLAWFTDASGAVRAATGRGPQGHERLVLVRGSAQEEFESLVDTDDLRVADLGFAGFDADPGRIFVRTSEDTGRQAVYPLDLESLERGSAVVTDPEFDVAAGYVESAEGGLVAVEVERDRPGLQFLDADAAAAQAAIDAAFPHTTNRVVSRDASGRQQLVEVAGDRSPPAFYLLRAGLGEMEFLYEALPDVSADRLAETRAVSFPTRDGNTLHGYLTLPRGERGPLPVIVIAHGGPSARVSWGWDATVQFLADRGFAVFQPNFGGSTGYGRAVEQRGWRQWGRRIQDDVDDGVDWLIESGIAAPGRVGIYGRGFGGYVALASALREPSRFRAVASFGGLTDLRALVDAPREYVNLDPNGPVYGTLPSDLELLEVISPAHQAERMRVPVLLGHGTKDPFVDVAQTQRLARALEAAGRPPELFLYRGALDVFLEAEQRIDFHMRLARFFEAHLRAVEPL